MIRFTQWVKKKKGVTEVGKIWGKVLDPIPWPPVDITDEENAIEDSEEPQVAEKIKVGT